MTLDEAITLSADRDLSVEEVKMLLSSSATSSEVALNALSIDVARRYMSDRLSFQLADSLMNALWAFTVEHEDRIPSLLYSVYEAFDAGEYHHREDAPEIDPEKKYTRPQISQILGNLSEA
ncbi:MAG TPA: hypothetical protein VH814_12780 [Steroidobacteraceae bacterium]|jgi:hypothetical protein